MNKIKELINKNGYSVEYCNKIIEELKNSMNSSSADRQLDCSIAKVQDVLINGPTEAKEYIFELVFERFQFLIKKTIQNLFVLNTGKEDLMQEATLCFYNSILKYDINKGAFIRFTKIFIKRNIISLIIKSRKHVKNNVSFVYIDGFSNEISNNNYDDYIYYQMLDNNTMEDNIITIENTTEYINEMEKILTEKEKKAMYLYLKGISYEEIASICKMSEKSVDNSLHRAKSKLKNLYK